MAGPWRAGERGFLYYYMHDTNTYDQTGTMGTSNYKVAEVPNNYEDPTFNGDLHPGSHGVRVG